MMTTRPRLRSIIILLLTLLFIITPGLEKTHALASDEWWDIKWPYRIPVIVNHDGPVSVNLNFSQLFDKLGLDQARLDLRSIRVIPYKNGNYGTPLLYKETYSKIIIDADSLSDGTSGNWIPEESISEIWIDSERFTQGIGSIHLHAKITETSLSETGFFFQFIDSGSGDWSEYETLLYDVWTEVNNQAIDQTPDLYLFELEGIANCPKSQIKGPGKVMNRWNAVSVSLKPFGNCSSPDLSNLNTMRFQLKVNMPWDDGGYFDQGDEIDFWMDNFRIVDQDGNGQIIWHAENEFDKYYIYFDTLDHERHSEPPISNFADPISISNIGEPEAGGYFHKIEGVPENKIIVWNSPITEKILQTYQAPVSSNPLIISAAKGEIEPIQLVINSSLEQTLPISVGDLIHIDGLSIINASLFDLFRVDYIDLSKISDQYGRISKWPDPLFPLLNGQSVIFEEGQNQPIWIRIKVPKDAIPGIYNGNIYIGETAVPITLQVWNFSIPGTPLLESEFGLDWKIVIETYQAEACENEFRETVDQTFKNFCFSLTNLETPPTGDVYSLSSYEIQKAQNAQTNNNTKVWWQFTPTDTPPFANPAVIDRPGTDARILFWLAWLDRIDGLYYPQTTDWGDNPWINPMDEYSSNGNEFFFYPPNEDLLAFGPCSPERNRLIPSLRLELMREGLEDYAYLWMLNKAKPIIGVENQSDIMAREIIQSDTLFSHIPTPFYTIRSEIASILESEEIDAGKYLYLPVIFK